MVAIEPNEGTWATAAELFSDPAAIDDMPAYQRSFTPDLDRKGQAAYAIGDYSYMFAIAAVVPFVGFGLLPDFSLHNFALGYDARPIDHKGRSVEERRVRARFLDARVDTDNEAHATHPDTREVVDRATLCERLRRQIEDHFEPLVEALHAKSRLSRNALWRLAGDSLSQLSSTPDGASVA